MISLKVMLIILGVSTVIFLWLRRKYYILYWKLGGILGYPIIGAGLNFTKRENIISYLLELKKTCGNIFVGFLGLRPFLMLSQPEAVEKILTSSSFLDKSQIYHVLTDSVGNGLFNSKSSKWLHNRKLLNPSFNHKVLVSFFPVFNEVVKTFNMKLEDCIGKDEFDISELMTKCTMEIGCQTTMGKQMNFQNGDNSHILKAYVRIMEITTMRLFIPWLQSNFIYGLTSLRQQMVSTLALTRSFVTELIDSKMKDDKSTINSFHSTNEKVSDGIIKTPEIFLDQVLKLYKAGDLDADDVIDESNTMIVAAFETTANTMYLILICLAMHQEQQTKLFDEIYSYFPMDDFDVAYDDLQNFPFLDMVINETLRVLAPVPLVARTCTKDYDLGNNVIIPQGTEIAIDIFNMHRDESIWGPKAKEFNPENFLKENFEKIHPFAFIPFTKGIRNCIGWRYGILSVKVMLIQILRRYKFSTSFIFKDLNFVEDVTLKFVKTPLLTVEKR